MHHVWTVAKIPVLAVLCLAAVMVEYRYRVPGPAAFVFLPWLGIGLTGLSVITVLARIARTAPDHDPLRRAILVVERVDTALIVAFLTLVDGSLWAQVALDFVGALSNSM